MRDEILEAREEHAHAFIDAGVSLYPTWHEKRQTTADIHAHFSAIQEAKSVVTVCGRVMGKREHGGSTFADIHDEQGSVQILFKEDILGAQRYTLVAALDLGDIVSVSGTGEKTRAGEETIYATQWTLLAKSRHPLPDHWAGLQDVELRARAREQDLLVNKESFATFQKRSRIVQCIREFFYEQGFLEVETPILQNIPGGASARPFSTHHNALDLDLYLRVSPELYLKRLIVGGFEKVFEVGKSFRNEGIDRQHNPEFTSCEFYMAYASVEDLLPLTESLLVTIANRLHGSPTILYRERELHLAGPWKHVSLVDTLREKTGIDILRETSEQVYIEHFEHAQIPLPDAKTRPALVDALYTHYIRKDAWDPVVVEDFPVYMEPLAKRSEKNPELVQRIQLLIAGMELVKAYTELNDPVDQEDRFREQEQLRTRGDGEAQQTDEAFLQALRIGLPPTAGWGMGIDRLVALFTDTTHIRDVISFPLLRPENPHA